MPAEPLLLGPFGGGMNTSSDPSAVADEELVDCKNFELDLDRALKSRPPFVGIAVSGVVVASPIRMLTSAVFATGTYLIASTNTQTIAYDGATWTLITNTPSGAAVQYKNKVWIVPLGSTNGGNWDPVSGFVADTDIPRGTAAVIYKERLYVVPGRATGVTNESRLIFSAPGDFGNWPGANNIDITPGDGRRLMDLIIYNDNLVLFKEDTSYVFTYDIDPADATLRNINTTIGASTEDCVVTYENSVFIYHEGEVFEMVNYDFARINVKVPFQFDNTGPMPRQRPVSLSILGDRLMVRYFNRMYVYGLRTRTWGRWESLNDRLNNVGHFIVKPSSDLADVNDEYWAGSCLNNDFSVYRFKLLEESSLKENHLGVNYDINCSILTKNYDLAVSHMFKRLTHWGADIKTARNIVGIATPIVVGGETLWADINLIKTWDELGTWANPLGPLPSVTTQVVNSQGAFSIHARFLRALRFRKINFQIHLITDGTSVQGPCKIFSVTIHVLTKEVVPKAVN